MRRPSRSSILAHIRKGNLSDGFSARDIRRKEWSGLTEVDLIRAGLELLADFDWVEPRTTCTGGRPRVTYTISPKAVR